MPKVKVRKSAWLTLGARLFSEDGIEGINVERMARQLNCNKASFYWHFKTRDQFVNEMIGHWFENSVQPVVTSTDGHSDPGKRFEAFLRISFQDRSRKDFMFHLRKLASTSPELSALLNELTGKRLEFTEELLQDLGYSASESRIKASILLHFYVGWYEFNKFKADDKAIEEALELVRNFIEY